MVESTAPVAEICALSVRDRFGHRLLADINLSVKPSRPLFILGPSGAGKSTIVKALFGALPKQFRVTGEFVWRDRGAIPFADATELRRLGGRDLALLPQDARAALDPTMRLSGQLASLEPEAALSAVDLSPQILAGHPFMLSGGMVQRFSLASTLSHGAGLVIADEPTKGLDVHRRAQILSLLEKTLEWGHNWIVVTHDPACLRNLGGDAVMIVGGKVVEKTTAARLLQDPQHPYSKAWVASEPKRWPTRRAMPASRQILVETDNLSFSYKKNQPLFSGLQMRIAAGQIVGLLGDSGSGKSTLGNVLLGLNRPTAGSVSWLGGEDAYGRSAGRLRRFYQKLHQDPVSSFNPYRRIGRQLSDLHNVAPGLNTQKALAPLCERLQIDARLLERYPSELSGGEGQRMALARILLLDPRLIVADEPTSHLDPVLQREVIMLLRDVVLERQIGLLLISHDQILIDAVAPDTLFLSTGKNARQHQSS